MKIIITEEQKNKLFIPRKLSAEDNRYSEWNKEQPSITIDGNTFKLNQFDSETGEKTGLWLEKPDSIVSNYNKTKEFLSNIFNNLTIEGDYYYYENKRYIGQDLKNGVLWVRYDNFWEVLSDRYSLSYYEIQDLIHIWMELTYKLGSLTPFKQAWREVYRWS